MWGHMQKHQSGQEAEGRSRVGVGSYESKKCWWLSCVWLYVVSWTVAHQVPLSMGFSRQECWSGLPFPSPGDLPDPRMEPGLLHYRQILYHLSHQRSPGEHLGKVFFFFFFFFFFYFLFIVNFVIHWNETSLSLHVFPIRVSAKKAGQGEQLRTGCIWIILASFGL